MQCLNRPKCMHKGSLLEYCFVWFSDGPERSLVPFDLNRNENPLTGLEVLPPSIDCPTLHPTYRLLLGFLQFLGPLSAFHLDYHWSGQSISLSIP